jgi:hypothetical protein
MRFVALLFAVIALACSAPTELRAASIYDSNVMERLKLSGAQKQKMQKLVSKHRSQRNAIFREYGIDPNAKPDMNKLQRAAPKLQANAAAERAAAKTILSPEQLRVYDEVMRQIRARVMSAL